MAVVRSTQYPGRWNVPDSNSPQGSGKNRTSPTASDGSYFDQVWFNDSDSLHQALFIASGIAPNGTPDIGTASQIFDALLNNRWSTIGNYSVGTIVTASDGNQYYCNQPNGRDTSTSDPTTDTLDIWRRYPYEEISDSNGFARKYWDGTLEQDGYVTDNSGVGVTVNYPVSFVGIPQRVSVSSNDVGPAFSTWQSPTSTTLFIQKWISESGNPTSGSSSWSAKGKWV